MSCYFSFNKIAHKKQKPNNPKSCVTMVARKLSNSVANSSVSCVLKG